MDITRDIEETQETHTSIVRSIDEIQTAHTQIELERRSESLHTHRALDEVQTAHTHIDP